MIKLLTFFLSVLSGAVYGQSLPPPMSMWDDAYNSLLLYLRRPEDGDRYTPFKSTAATTGHYYYPMKIGADSFDLQVSAYQAETAVVGTECRACDVKKRFDHGNRPYIGQPMVGTFKNFDVKGPELGFIESSFMGRYVRDDMSFTVQGDKPKAVQNLTTYVIFNPLSTTQQYASEQSGILGLGPYTTGHDYTQEDSFTYQLRKEKVIDKNIVTYNITFNPNAGKGSQSYVQLGTVSRAVTSKMTIIQSVDWDWFKSPVTMTYIKTTDNKMYPFVEFNTTAIFDPQVDYMYMNQLEFDNFVVPILKQIYGAAVNCTDNECHFDTSCDKVAKRGASIFMSLSTEVSHYVQVSIDLENYLIDGRKQWNKTTDICYLPVFVSDPGQAIDVFATWFLGNMFLDRYLIVHNMEGASVGSKYKPRIGILDKTMMDNMVVNDPKFLQ